jgi:hypothetical protein
MCNDFLPQNPEGESENSKLMKSFFVSKFQSYRAGVVAGALERYIATHRPKEDELPITSGTPQKTVDNRPNLDFLAIAETAGKVRVASIHSADETLVARSLTAMCLPILAELPQCKDMLTGKVPILARCQHKDENDEDAETKPEPKSKPARKRRRNRSYRLQVESTDLSAATDHIPFEVARQILDAALEGAGVHNSWKVAAQIVCGPHTARWRPKADEDADGYLVGDSTCGAFMGLGPSWVVLSLLNAYAAIKAGIPSAACVICGDDAAILATKKERSLYHKHLAMSALVVNFTKSHVSDIPKWQDLPDSKTAKPIKTFGIFCERKADCTAENYSTKNPYHRRRFNDNANYSRPTHLIRVEFRDAIRLAEAAGLAAGENMTGYESAEALRRAPQEGRPCHRVIKRLRSYTAKRLAMGGGGSLADGGLGRGRADATSFKVLLTYGKTSFKRKVPTRLQKLNSLKMRDMALRITNLPGHLGPRDVARKLGVRRYNPKDERPFDVRIAAAAPASQLRPVDDLSLPAGFIRRSDALADYATTLNQLAIVLGDRPWKAKTLSSQSIRSHQMARRTKVQKESYWTLLKARRDDGTISKMKYAQIAQHLAAANVGRACRVYANDDPIIFLDQPLSECLEHDFERLLLPLKSLDTSHHRKAPAITLNELAENLSLLRLPDGVRQPFKST